MSLPELLLGMKFEVLTAVKMVVVIGVVISCGLVHLHLKMELIHFYEMLVPPYKTIQHHNPEDND
jgi:hypothetical protein